MMPVPPLTVHSEPPTFWQEINTVVAFVNILETNIIALAAALAALQASVNLLSGGGGAGGSTGGGNEPPSQLPSDLRPPDTPSDPINSVPGIGTGGGGIKERPGIDSPSDPTNPDGPGSIDPRGGGIIN
jgi:hypothetical protein